MCKSYLLEKLAKNSVFSVNDQAYETDQGMSHGWCYFCYHVWYSHEENGKRLCSSFKFKILLSLG